MVKCTSTKTACFNAYCASTKCGIAIYVMAIFDNLVFNSFLLHKCIHKLSYHTLPCECVYFNFWFYFEFQASGAEDLCDLCSHEYSRLEYDLKYDITHSLIYYAANTDIERKPCNCLWSKASAYFLTFVSPKLYFTAHE